MSLRSDIFHFGLSGSVETEYRLINLIGLMPGLPRIRPGGYTTLEGLGVGKGHGDVRVKWEARYHCWTLQKGGVCFIL